MIRVDRIHEGVESFMIVSEDKRDNNPYFNLFKAIKSATDKWF